MNKKGFVYLLCDLSKDNVYKIGITRGKIENRIKKLQTGNSGEIIMSKYFETDYPFFLERMLHKKYHSSNIMNEWFELTNFEAVNFVEDCLEIEKIIEAMKDNPFFEKNLK